MRVIQTVNDTIRLLFNPKSEIFNLSDFLLIHDCDENFLAQVIEVYDDKFDQESNVAKIKLIYRIKDDNEIVPYDNYTPSRECEVAKIKHSEIEKCINLGKKTLKIGINPKNGEPVVINENFFLNNLVIFSDKFEQTNQIFSNLAPRLSEKKNVVVLDFSGSCDIEDANVFVAGETFKMPLSSHTIDYIQQKILIRAKLETQVVLSDVFNEVREYLETSEEDYISITKFIKVIQSQCKNTPSVQLLVLMSWLKKYARAQIFAKNKKEFEGFLKSVTKNKITVVDMSNIKAEWQKEYLDFVQDIIKNDIFLFARLNDNNINNDILNSIYLKKSNISFIPSFAYGFRKASYIMDFAQNYILMPTLNPKRDFIHANFQIQSLNKESFMIFGSDTKDFIFTVQNETPVKQQREEKTNDKMFISLNLQLEDMTPVELRPNNLEVKTQSFKKRLHEEIKLSDILSISNPKEDKNEPSIQIKEPPQDISFEQTEQQGILQEPDEIGAETEIETEAETEVSESCVEDILGEDELDYIEPEETNEISEQDDDIQIEQQETETTEETEATEEIQSEESELSQEDEDFLPEKEDYTEQIHPKDENLPSQKDESLAEQHPADIDLPNETEIISDEDFQEINNLPNEPETNGKEDNEPEKEDNEPDFAQAQEQQDFINTDIIDLQPESANESANETVNESANELANELTNELANESLVESDTLESQKQSDIEQTANEIDTEAEKVIDDYMLDLIDANNQKKATEENIPEEDIENQEINAKFEEILNSEEDSFEDSSIRINEDVSIDLTKIKEGIRTPEKTLPVFTDDTPKSKEQNYSQGDSVYHEKYGLGTVLKIISYGNRSLLQIEFPNIGKRLLDPKIAKLEIRNPIS